MEVSFAIACKDFAIIATDPTAGRSIVKMKGDLDKQKVISNNLVLAYSGEPGDTTAFAEYVERNLKLYEIRNHTPLTTHSAASWTRNTIATSLRSRHPYNVNLLLAGYDPTLGVASAYWMDYLGTFAKVPYAAHGYGAYFSLSTFDHYYKPTLTLTEALDLLGKGLDELNQRFMIQLGTFVIRVIDKDGVRLVNLKGEVVPPPDAPATTAPTATETTAPEAAPVAA